VALTTGISPLAAQWEYMFPEKMLPYFEKYVMFENIPETELRQWENDFFVLVKKISLANQDKQLVLKNPPNTARIKLLLSLFPDAVFIHIRRDPYEVYSSNIKLLRVLQDWYSLGSTRSVDHIKTVIETYSRIMQRYLLEIDLIKPGRLMEIEYGDFLKDPVATMKQIYQSLQLGDFSYCEPKMRAYAALQEKYIVLHHVLTEEEEKNVSESWGPIIRQLGYSVR
jgi:hypothetical protein